jgi:cysteine desulfurase
MMSDKPIYLDYNATTPVDERVLQAMLPWFCESFGNAASRTHLYGWEAQEAVEEARKQLAKLLNARPKDIVWLSGATEANNLAIKGIFERHTSKGKHIVTVKTEHKAVLDVCENLKNKGADITYLTPQPDGLLTLQQIKDALRPDTVLVSVMYANNEIGVLQPIAEIAQVVHKNGTLLHSDATQAVGKVPIDIQADGIDLLSLSAHKLYGPKGVGALVVRQGVEITAQIDGGGHERGQRSGTLNVPGIVGLGMACQIAQNELLNENIRISCLRNKLENEVTKTISNTFINGNAAHRLPNTTNICFEGTDGENLLMTLSKIAVSNGSACTSAAVLPSFVLKALGLSDAQAAASIRFTLGRFTTADDIDRAITHICSVVPNLRHLSH